MTEERRYMHNNFPYEPLPQVKRYEDVIPIFDFSANPQKRYEAQRRAWRAAHKERDIRSVE